MIRLATMNASGEITTALGSRNGRSAPGRFRRRAPMESGAPAYMSTLAEVTRPTSECQLGNGKVKTRPAMNATIMPNHGTPRRSTAPKMLGKYLFLARPYDTREVEVL